MSDQSRITMHCQVNFKVNVVSLLPCDVILTFDSAAVKMYVPIVRTMPSPLEIGNQIDIIYYIHSVVST